MRPGTVIELANEQGYTDLPTSDPAELAKWFTRGADRRNLVLYLETFAHTVGVTQTKDGLARAAAECAEDLAADGVVYAEIRFAPELHTQAGLSLDEVVESVLEGFRIGMANAAAAGTPILIGTLVTAMRTAAHSLEIAELGVRHRDDGVVGFDIAGAEAGYPPTIHLGAFQYVMRQNFHITIHAGEAFGLPSIHEALQYCGAERLGHGVRIVDDITLDGDGAPQLGRLASYILDRRVPLEMCPTSNVNTGATDTYESHPIKMLRELRFRVTLNTDNRLMSNVSMTDEFEKSCRAFGWDLHDMQWLTVNAMKSSFWPFRERLDLINDVIKPQYAALMAS